MCFTEDALGGKARFTHVHRLNGKEIQI